jgi:tRNA dimethylallyltransferase
LTSAQFEKLAMEILEEEFKTKEVVILVGGSGMFIDALCLGLDDIPTSPEIKKQIQLEYDEDGLYPLLDELKDKDPEYYDEVDQNNSMRVQRAIEVIRITGKKFSDLRKSKPVPRPFKVYRFVIDHDRDVLYDRINRRVDLMLEEGLLEEVKSVEQYRNLSSLNTVGYKELFEFLDGKIAFQEAVELIKRNTRRYAKRQLTWFRRHPETHWIPYDTAEVMVKKVIGIFNAQ